MDKAGQEGQSDEVADVGQAGWFDKVDQVAQVVDCYLGNGIDQCRASDCPNWPGWPRQTCKLKAAIRSDWSCGTRLDLYLRTFRPTLERHVRHPRPKLDQY